MNKDRDIINWLARYVKGCKDCGGRPCVRLFAKGEYCYDIIEVSCDDCDKEHLRIPCPTCAPWRELDLCWHKWRGWDGKGIWHCSCGYISRTLDEAKKHMHEHPQTPDLTTAMHGPIPLIVHYLQVVGLLDEFQTYLWNKVIGDFCCNIQVIKHDSDKWRGMNNVIINGILRRDAIWSFMEGRDKG